MAKTQKKPYKSKAHPKKKNQSKDFHKVYWPFIPSILMIVLSLLMVFSSPARDMSQRMVLSYASEMSRSGLLSNTNDQRTSNGLGSLALNDKLNSAAQAKANDMIARNYWSHNTPDGKEPWIFFENAGYAYLKAGENLAYGFANSSATVEGWMNSPGHRANILDKNYQEVGFGFANAPDYVGTGEETVVVAMYGQPKAAQAAAPKPVATPTPKTQSAKQQAPANAAPQLPSKVVIPVPVEEAAKEQPETEIRTDVAFNSELPAGTEVNTKPVSKIQSWTNGAAPWSAAAISLVGLAVAIIWIAKHALIVKRALIHGEEWALHHPLVDFAVLTLVAATVYLSTASGIIR